MVEQGRLVQLVVELLGCGLPEEVDVADLRSFNQPSTFPKDLLHDLRVVAFAHMKLV